MIEILIGAVASLIQQYLIKVEDKTLRKVYSIMICFIVVLCYDIFMDVATDDFISRLSGAYGGGQILYNMFFNPTKD